MELGNRNSGLIKRNGGTRILFRLKSCKEWLNQLNLRYMINIYYKSDNRIYVSNQGSNNSFRFKKIERINNNV